MESSIPQFRLPDEQGQPWGSRDLVHRREMIVVVLPQGGCRSCRRTLEVLAHRQEMSNLSDAAVLVVASGEGLGEAKGMALPFPVLHDADGTVAGELTKAAGVAADEAVILVADRNGRIDWACALQDEDAEVLVDAAVDSLDRAGAQCPG